MDQTEKASIRKIIENTPSKNLPEVLNFLIPPDVDEAISQMEKVKERLKELEGKQEKVV